MGKIYTAQDQLVLYISTGSSLVEASSVLIQGTDPSGNTMAPELLTTIEDSTLGLVSFEILSTTFTAAGTWILWAHVNYIGGGDAWGEPFHLNVYEPGL